MPKFSLSRPRSNSKPQDKQSDKKGKKKKEEKANKIKKDPKNNVSSTSLDPADSTKKQSLTDTNERRDSNDNINKHDNAKADKLQVAEDDDDIYEKTDSLFNTGTTGVSSAMTTSGPKSEAQGDQDEVTDVADTSPYAAAADIMSHGAGKSDDDTEDLYSHLFGSGPAGLPRPGTLVQDDSTYDTLDVMDTNSVSKRVDHPLDKEKTKKAQNMSSKLSAKLLTKKPLNRGRMKLPTREPAKTPIREPAKIPTREPAKTPTREPAKIPNLFLSNLANREPAPLPTKQIVSKSKSVGTYDDVDLSRRPAFVSRASFEIPASNMNSSDDTYEDVTLVSLPTSKEQSDSPKSNDDLYEDVSVTFPLVKESNELQESNDSDGVDVYEDVSDVADQKIPAKPAGEEPNNKIDQDDEDVPEDSTSPNKSNVSVGDDVYEDVSDVVIKKIPTKPAGEEANNKKYQNDGEKSEESSDPRQSDVPAGDDVYEDISEVAIPKIVDKPDVEEPNNIKDQDDEEEPEGSGASHKSDVCVGDDIYEDVSDVTIQEIVDKPATGSEQRKQNLQSTKFNKIDEDDEKLPDESSDSHKSNEATGDDLYEDVSNVALQKVSVKSSAAIEEMKRNLQFLNINNEQNDEKSDILTALPVIPSSSSPPSTKPSPKIVDDSSGSETKPEIKNPSKKNPGNWFHKNSSKTKPPSSSKMFGGLKKLKFHKKTLSVEDLIDERNLSAAEIHTQNTEHRAPSPSHIGELELEESRIYKSQQDKLK